MMRKKERKTIPVLHSLAERYRSVKYSRKKPERFALIMMYFVLPFLINIVIQCMELKSISKGLHFVVTSPYIFLANTLIIVMTLSITLLFKKRYFWVTIGCAIWLVFGFSNLILLCNRVTPFTASDLFLIDSLFDVIEKYFNLFQIALIAVLVVALIIILVLLFFRAPKLDHKINYIHALNYICTISLITIGAIKLGVATGIMDGQFAELSAAYRKNGFAYCFTNSLIDTGVSKPRDYSPEYMTKILENDHTTLFADRADKTPNIVFVQLETFFNVQELNDVTFSDTVLPNFTKLQKDAGGLFEVPVIGAGTVNTEFEVLTGMSMDHFGAGEYPFKTILTKTTTESLAYNLKTYGYHTHALHNNTGTFYGRNLVYSNLGFDDFTSIEYMKDYEKTVTGWAKDYCLTDYIMQCLKKTKNQQDFVYAISVQGHGGYNITEPYEKHITVTDISEERASSKNAIEYYANMMWEMDDYVGQLIDALSEFDEDVILVMYGDHLPSLDITPEELNNRTIYQTDYIMWSNFGMKFKKGNMQANEISSYIMKKLGMSNGIINSYRQKHSNDYDFDECLAALEFDMLYGKNIVYTGINPYKPTDIVFGLDPVLITNVVKDETSEDTYIIRGDNFTNYSRIFVNGERYDATLIDEHTLSFHYDGILNAGDIINVWQSRLSGTEDYIYNMIQLEMTSEAKEKLQQLDSEDE